MARQSKIKQMYYFGKQYLTRQQCIWFICHILTKHDTYHTQILEEILKYADHTTSVGMVNAAIKELQSMRLIESYNQPLLQGRGKARKMYKLTNHAHAVASDWSNLWQEFVG